MNGEPPASDDRAALESRALRYARGALNGVCAMLPHLAGLAAWVRIQVDSRVGTACVAASGRLLIDPEWFLDLPTTDAIFVLAHELLHLAFESHQRGKGADTRLFNIAHDFVINDLLRKELGCEIPAGGLDLSGASELSAEKIVGDLRQRERAGQSLPDPGWGRGGGSALSEALRRAGLAPTSPELLTEELEREWFPDDDPEQTRVREEDIRRAGRQAVELGVIHSNLEVAERLQQGSGSGDATGMAIALEARYAPPWQEAMQPWIEAVAPGPRSYARPSRRGADRTDVALPGRKREGWTLHLVLDTSGSMTGSIPLVLGAISAFCEEMNIGCVHVVQCDVTVTHDEMVAPEDLKNFRVHGFGGSNMTPAMMRLAQDPEVEAVIVITDGDIFYPQTPMPYEVLWVLDQDRSFHPPYGSVIALERG